VPRRSGKVPSYCLHKEYGRAVVRLEGSDHYLGLYGSPEAASSIRDSSPAGNQSPVQRKFGVDKVLPNSRLTA
jgi:hypothetical protein